MNDVKLEQPSWKELVKHCVQIILVAGGFTLGIYGVNVLFSFVINWIIGVI